MAFCSAALMIISVLLNAPLEAPADPDGIPAENVKAPWIFVGIQQILKWLPAEIAGLILPSLAVLALCLIPYLNLNSFWRGALFVGVTLSIVVFTVWGYIS
ncbi:MAG: hypothetical protein PHS86_11655 [Syntrophaceae bacterium]|nr:hypothetical protein [Syntrophaceae bacterium]